MKEFDVSVRARIQQSRILASQVIYIHQMNAQSYFRIRLSLVVIHSTIFSESCPELVRIASARFHHSVHQWI
jgi:hypothetical protein